MLSISVRPSTYSSAMYAGSPCASKAKALAMFGCSSSSRIFASRANRSMICGRSRRCGWRSLIATSLSSAAVSVASQTVPKAPLPSSFVSLKRPPTIAPAWSPSRLKRPWYHRPVPALPILAPLLFVAQELVLDERAPLAMLVIAPSGSAWPPAIDLYRAADEALRPRTSLRVRSAEQAGLDVAQIAACELKERLSCWARVAKSGHLFAVSVLPLDPKKTKLTGIFLDVGAALE